jgi:uncharacterized protein (TIGR02099 family)
LRVSFALRLRRLRLALITTCSTLVIVAALLVALVQLALPWLTQHPERVAEWVSERLGREVRFASLQGLWTRSGPRLILGDVEIVDVGGSAPLRVPRAEIALNLYAAFQKNRAWNEFRLVGLDLALVRNADESWQLHGASLDAASSNESASMGALGALVIADLKLSVVDAARKIDLDLRIPELRVVNLGSITRILGRVGSARTQASAMSMVADIDLAARSGRVYIGGRALDLAEVGASQLLTGISAPTGDADIEVWADWRQGRIDDMRLRLALRDASLATSEPLSSDAKDHDLPRTHFEHLALSARWLRQGEGDWIFDLADMRVTHEGVEQPPARLRVQKSGGDQASFEVAGNELDIDALASIALLSNRLPQKLRNWLHKAHPKGRIAAVEGLWSSAEDFDADVLLDQVAIGSVESIPGVDALTLRMRADAQGVLLEIPAQATRVDYASAFREPFELTKISGEFAAWREKDEWRAKTPRLDVVAEDYAFEVQGGLEFQNDGSKPLLDLTAVVTGANVLAAKGFWPITTMPENAINWLDRALVSGRISHGRVVFRGDLDQWPFVDHSGRFEAIAQLEDLTLDYLPEWPVGEQLKITANFINSGMHAVVASGKSMDLSIDSAEGIIARFGEAVLDLKAKTHGEGRALLSFLRATPIGESYSSALDGLSIGGNGAASFSLSVPLKEHDKLQLDGSVDLVDADLAEKNWNVRFDKANGRVRFGRAGVAAEELAVAMEGRPAKLGIFIGDKTRDTRNSFEARLNATLPPALVFSHAPDIAQALPFFPGEAAWDIALDVGDDAGERKDFRELRVESDLRGIAIELPRPLAKPADTALPLSIGIEIPPLGRPFRLDLGEVMHIRGRIPSPSLPLAAQIEMGRTTNTPVPKAGISITGNALVFDAGGWGTMFAAGGVGDDLFNGLSLDIGALEVAGRSIPNVHVDLSRERNTTSIRFTGDALDGVIDIPGDDLRRSGITAHLNRLHWPDAPEGAESAPAAMSGIAPSSIPPLHLSIGELNAGKASLGSLRFESFPTATGMQIDMLEARSPNVDIRASGEWAGDEKHNYSRLNIDMSAHSLGRMLDAFGFAGIIDGGQTLAHIEATWPGAPSAFALADMSGSLQIDVDKGRILDVDPGAGGRLFGLLSLREIPRRLSLDFSDLFKSGMAFNAINGTFKLNDGHATTDDLRINSPAADIEISGRTGLRDKDYDQQMIVTPRAGVALPVVGAIAGGPVGAAAGLVVQGLIGKQINEVARSRYRVTGSWEKPTIELLAREVEKAPPRTKESPPAARKPDSGER